MNGMKHHLDTQIQSFTMKTPGSVGSDPLRSKVCVEQIKYYKKLDFYFVYLCTPPNSFCVCYIELTKL